MEALAGGTGKPGRGYTTIDFALLGAVAAVVSIIFWAAWFVYDIGTSLLGPFGGVLISYGLWYVGAILAMSIIRKPGAALVGETLAAAIEVILPAPGGLYNLAYGFLQGVFAEIAYFLTGYRLTPLAHAVAGAASAIGTMIANLLLFKTLIYEADPTQGFIVFAAVAVGYAVSGAIWGVIAGSIGAVVRRLLP